MSDSDEIGSKSCSEQRGLGVLLVDREDCIRQILRIVLSRTWNEDNFETYEADCLDDSQRIIESTQIDLLVTAHLGVKGGDGVSLVHWLWEKTERLHTPVVFHTASTLEEIEAGGLNRADPFLYYILKPSHPVDIIEVLERALTDHGLPVPKRRDGVKLAKSVNTAGGEGNYWSMRYASRDIHVVEADYHRHIALFAYECSLKHGCGVVMIHEEKHVQHEDGTVEATLTFLPYAKAGSNLPSDVIAHLPDYDVEESCVLCMINKEMTAVVRILSEEDLGATPKALAAKDIE